VEPEIDYAIMLVPAAALLRVIRECIQKKVKVAQIYTAGFSETGIPERIEMEKRLKETAAGKIRLIGPNCFGVYSPRSGLAIVPESPGEEGHIGVVTQSGSVAESFSYFARTKNLRFSKVVSYGNAVDLDAPDFLDHLADDPDTQMIAFYVEGTRNAARLKTALTKAARNKPVVAIKGGMTDQGLRAAASHTASLTGTPEIWQALFSQAGVLQVESFEEMTNILLALGGSPAPAGRAVAIITNSGGFSVIQTDLCLKAGIEVPRFSPDTIKKLRQLVPIAGTSIGNPLDAWPIFYNTSAEGNLADIIKTVSGDGNIDSLVFQFDQFRYLRRVLGPAAGAHLEKVIQFMIEGFEHTRDRQKKPVLVTVSLDPYLEDQEDRNMNLKMKRTLSERGFPVYANLDGAVKALANLYRLAQFRARG
jgi:acyl-CoA synthetase (NDP forming)